MNRTITVEVNEHAVTLPAKLALCTRCEGEGHITNPSIGAITGEEWENDWSEEEREAYLSGGYDIECPDCHGTGKVRVIDRRKLLDADLVYWHGLLRKRQSRARLLRRVDETRRARAEAEAEYAEEVRRERLMLHGHE